MAQGIVRKLRLGMTLKRAKEGGYELDMTSTRYKTSRFCECSVRMRHVPTYTTDQRACHVQTDRASIRCPACSLSRWAST